MADRPVLKLKSSKTSPSPTEVATKAPVVLVEPVVTEPPVTQAPPSAPSASETPQLPLVCQEKKAKKRIMFGEDVDAFLAVLCQNHPEHFPGRGQPGKNWAIGFLNEIVEKYSNVPLETCRLALKLWVMRCHFQHEKLLSMGGSRYHLNGEIAGEVTPEQQARSRANLQLMLAKIKDKRRVSRKLAKNSKKPKVTSAPVICSSDTGG